METLERIKKKMEDAGVDSIDFMYHRQRPIITKDYRRYEIYAIFKPEDGEDALTLGVISYSPYRAQDLKIDAKSRKSTWAMLERIVKESIDERNRDYYN